MKAPFPWEPIRSDLPAERKDAAELPSERYVWASAQLPAASQVADVACGYGYGSAILRQRHLVVGVDIQREAIAYAVARYPGMYVVANAEAQSFAGFDAVVCLEALSHMLDPYCWIKNLDVTHLVISMPLTPSMGIYPWRKHEIPDEMFRSMLTPRWEIQNELRQQSTPTEAYLTIYARR